MTSEIEALKTNEFLRRRKLRLQQVREQSKDIAKKIRQRAKVEKLRQVVDLDLKKQKEYLNRQGELVKKLENLYVQGIDNVGASHGSASEIIQDELHENVDLSKVRGKEAAAELRRKRQEKLDEQKKLLDRKLQAREAANELSREKSAVTTKQTKKNTEDTQSKANNLPKEILNNDKNFDEASKEKPITNDMATQWGFEGLPNEWEPNIPTLQLPIDDRDNLKETNNNTESKSDKSKRLDLFALSDEMPSSLRGGVTNEERLPVKSSLTLVSEYLQNRGLRLREPDTTGSSKKHSDDLLSIKHTIQRTRSSKPEGSQFNVCHVLDEQVIPVPSWQAEKNCEFCSHSVSHHYSKKKQFHVTNSQINKIFSSIRPPQQDLLPSPVLRGMSPFSRSSCQRVSKGSHIDKSTKCTAPENTLTKKPSVMIYNHSTRDTRDIPYADEKIVSRDRQKDEDAYSQAMRETSLDNNIKDKEHQKKIQDMRNKVAMTKQNVEKEYKDTINFLNSLPKDKGNRPVKAAYMDDRRQQMLKESRQQKLQQEFKKIEKDCRKHSCTKNRSKSKSPAKDVADDFNSSEFQYSWMPVPESDGTLAVHTIPTTLKQDKSTEGGGATVKFSKVDSYHEYRSRHKHTPPTRDTAGREKLVNVNKRIEAVIIENSSSDTEYSSIPSDTSSVDNIRLRSKEGKPKNDKDLSDAERIIIYKILDSKNGKRKCKNKAKLVKEIAKSLTCLEKPQKVMYTDDKEPKDQHIKRSNDNPENKISFEQINEGIYKTVNGKGLSYNIMNCYATNVELWQTTADRQPWWDNITSMYFADSPREAQNINLTGDDIKHGRPCRCNKKLSVDEQRDVGNDLRWESGDTPARKPSTCVGCKCGCVGSSKLKEIPIGVQPSAATSTSSFKTATNDKANNALPDSGYIKLIDDGGQEAGKFYIGASGFLKDDAYEVVIQLRKKDGSDKTDEKETAEKSSEKDTTKSSAELLEPVTQVQITSKNIEENNNIVLKPVDGGSKVLPPKWLPSNQEAIIEKPSEESIKQKEETLADNESNDDVDNNINPLNNVFDKGVDTQSQMSYAIPNHFPKTDPFHRPATSTYTQTSLCSPNHRPIFFHMSSSTSTAYMSPPEMVLPTFLRQDYRFNSDDMYDPMQNINLQERSEALEQQAYNAEYESCRCKRCTLSNKVCLSKTKPIHFCKKHSRHGNVNTPPNTTRSCPSEHAQDINDDTHKLREHKVKCRKSKIYTLPQTSVKSQYHKNKRVHPANIRSQNHLLRVNSSAASSYKNKNTETNKNICKTNLNPVIKEYVQKLLQLNKEGLKVVDVADQDCSSVATPGSSIINVPYNVNINKSLESKISLEQIKTMLKEQILNDYIKKIQNNVNTSVTCTKNNVKNIKIARIPRKKPVHKIKSLNISRKIQKTVSSGETKRSSNNIVSPSPTTMENVAKLPIGSIPSKTKFRSKSSPTPRQYHNMEAKRKVTTPDILSEREINNYNSKRNRGCDTIFFEKKPNNYLVHTPSENQRKREAFTLPSDRASSTTSPDFETVPITQKQLRKDEIPMNTATQTNENIDSEIDFTKLAEDKLQNMEKIADLTEKCTKRLSNLARVLEEVRKNKSLAYSQISTSDCTSDSDQKSNKNVSDSKTPLQINPTIDQNKSDTKSSSSVSAADKSEEKLIQPFISPDYVPFLSDIPKPSASKTPDSSFLSLSSKSSDNSKLLTPVINLETPLSKSRGKPPPALSRIHLKNGQENVVPHELSTVLEVDSPMSVKLKNQSSRDTRGDVTDSLSRPTNENKEDKRDDIPNKTVGNKELVSSNLLRSNLDLSKQRTKDSNTESSDESKLQMMDLKKFNEIMLKPFITFQEHAKKCNVALEDGSNLEDIPKDAVIDDISSFHSDGSLPDVIAELLKRNIISEPFKFDTASNVNSTTVSSESTLSVLALSNMRKDKKKSSVMFQNNENVGETSDSLSISSNPDLENAFKKLGMRWASSTLRKTKERLALSSSSNTSSSSLSQFKLKSFNNQDIPVLMSDSVTSVNVSKRSRNLPDSSKNAEQQTSLTNSMTVKEFLNNELAKKITFTNKSNRNDSDEEFVSLFETKMPDDMKHSSQMIREEQSIDSVPSGNNNRARTSTPVQLFKSMTYHSSSSSYISNGLFSNADDLSSVKVTSNSIKNHSTSEKDDLTVPNFSLKMKKSLSDSKSD